MAPRISKRDAIVEAAGRLLLKHGRRGTSMEAIAQAAGVAKPTLYAYFADRQAVFAALAEQVIAGWRDDFLGALGGDGELWLCVAAALAARHKATMRLRAATPHGELYTEDDPVTAAAVRSFEAELADALEAELVSAGIGRPRLLAQLLLAAASGIARKAQSPAELGPALRLLCERLLARGGDAA